VSHVLPLAAGLIAAGCGAFMTAIGTRLGEAGLYPWYLVQAVGVALTGAGLIVAAAGAVVLAVR
jgi:hypothetical protein